MKLSNKIVAMLAALSLSVVAVACGNASGNSAAPEASAAVEAPAADASNEKLTEEDYKAKVLELFTNVTEVAPELAAVDQSDFEAVVAATKKVAEVTKASYGEMANLKAPDSFADVQVDIKEGAEASNRIMDISLEMIQLGEVEMSEEEATAKAKELQGELAELSAKAAKLSAGLVTVLGTDVVSGAAAAAAE